MGERPQCNLSFPAEQERVWIARSILICLLFLLRAGGQRLGGFQRGYGRTRREHASNAASALRIKVLDLGTGQKIVQQNAASFFTPASNVKLYTTAFAHYGDRSRR